MLKGTQRRFTIGIAAIAAVSPALLMVRPASAFPPGHAVSKFNYKFQASTHIARLEKTIAPPSGAFTGGVDMVTNQLSGGFKLPNSSFNDAVGGSHECHRRAGADQAALGSHQSQDPANHCNVDIRHAHRDRLPVDVSRAEPASRRRPGGAAAGDAAPVAGDAPDRAGHPADACRSPCRPRLRPRHPSTWWGTTVRAPKRSP